jgi:hypothetical protein
MIMLVFSTVPAFAANNAPADVQENIIYQRQIEVTSKGGVYQVGFVTVKFPKDFIDSNQLPVTINVEISAVDGVAGIEFQPDIPEFNKEVTIIVHPYNGQLFDKSVGTNIPVQIINQKMTVEHFSRYAFS